MGTLRPAMAEPTQAVSGLKAGEPMSNETTWVILMSAVGIFGALSWWLDRLESYRHHVRWTAAAGILSMLALLYWTWKP